ncbi:hypothetical protein BT96DRAFT_1017870 [Gymnopus androsaceus JB14]|uniref:Zn(2)-C6 fungal-type domain-containing protein n=1 Tax=Gymnopus androsaceus JB14 TaxID=1447944 RepID=A0A6A4HYP1_9AGAR|nr:hypothetical protein BT96DRAFT_1017870 [Gymnopus androsaceus JB14]
MSTKATSMKRKKLPACDSCKARRVLCHPQSNGPCPRCSEKGVNCTTTPVVRRKRRTKVQLVQSSEGAGSSSTSPCIPPDASSVENAVVAVSMRSTSFSGALSEPSPVPPSLEMPVAMVEEAQLAQSLESAGSSPCTPPDASSSVENAVVAAFMRSSSFMGTFSEPSPVPPSLEIPAAMVEELIESLRISPIINHPLISLSKIEALLLSSTNLLSLQPQDRVLLHCLMAFSSLSSMSPFVIGTEEISDEQSLIFSADSPLKAPIIPDLRQIGFRREPVFLKLWAEALWLANQEGIATNPSSVNAASCWVLGHIAQVVLGRGASPFNLAFVCHVRCLAEEGELGNIHSLTYHSHMIGDVLTALTTGRSIQYTANDELLIVRYIPEPLETLLRVATTKSFTATEVFMSVHPFAHHLTRLARETSDNLTGVFARTQPLDESFLIKHFASLDLFHSFLLAVLDQIPQILQQSCNKLLEIYYLRVCSSGFGVVWGSLVLPIFEALRDRSLQFAFNATFWDSSNGSVSSLADDRNYERLQMHLRHARRLASTAAVEICKALREAPSITRLTHRSELVRWARFLMDEDNVMNITPEQCIQALECFRDVIQVAGFCCADRTGIVESINEYLAMRHVSTRNDYSTGFEALSSFTAVSSIDSLVPLV